MSFLLCWDLCIISVYNTKKVVVIGHLKQNTTQVITYQSLADCTVVAEGLCQAQKTNFAARWNTNGVCKMRLVYTYAELTIAEMVQLLISTTTTPTTYLSDKRRGNDGQGKRHPPVYQKPRSTLPVMSNVKTRSSSIIKRSCANIQITVPIKLTNKLSGHV